HITTPDPQDVSRPHRSPPNSGLVPLPYRSPRPHIPTRRPVRAAGEEAEAESLRLADPASRRDETHGGETRYQNYVPFVDVTDARGRSFFRHLVHQLEAVSMALPDAAGVARGRTPPPSGCFRLYRGG